MKRLAIATTLAATVGMFTMGAASVQAKGHSRTVTYEITVTNITKGMSFTPVLAATHASNVSLFDIGEPASEALGAIAEGGAIGDLKAELDANNRVHQTASTEGLLGPGESVTFEIESNRRMPFFSVTSMLLPTNDTIFAVNGEFLPWYAEKTYLANAYDAGTETNDELCVSIPGPQCGGAGVPFSPEDAGEGFVYPSPAISGDADLSRLDYNWQGPVAAITVKRL